MFRRILVIDVLLEYIIYNYWGNLFNFCVKFFIFKVIVVIVLVIFVIFVKEILYVGLFFLDVVCMSICIYIYIIFG